MYNLIPNNFYTASAQLAMQSAVLAIVNPSEPHDSGFLMVNFNAKFQREDREQGCQMRVG